jgi:hypothetical protein
MVEARREVSRELFWVCCFEWTLFHLFKWNQESGLTIYNDFFDAAHGARHNAVSQAIASRLIMPNWFVD